MDSEAKEITSQRVSLSGKGTEREEREWRDELINRIRREWTCKHRGVSCHRGRCDQGGVCLLTDKGKTHSRSPPHHTCTHPLPPRLPSVENNAYPGPSLWTMLTCVCTFFLRSLWGNSPRTHRPVITATLVQHLYCPFPSGLTIKAIQTPQQQVVDSLPFFRILWNKDTQTSEVHKTTSPKYECVITHLAEQGQRQNEASVTAKRDVAGLRWLEFQSHWNQPNRTRIVEEKADPLFCNQSQELRAKCQPAQKATTYRRLHSFLLE